MEGVGKKDTNTESILSNVAPPTDITSFLTSPFPDSAQSTCDVKVVPPLVAISKPSDSVIESSPVISDEFVSSTRKNADESCKEDSSETAHLTSVDSDHLTKEKNKPGWIGWLQGTVSSVGHKVATKAMNSMDAMITTLDPQMKDYIRSGGDIEIIVASDKEVKVSPIREAFQTTFGKATVNGMASESEGIAAQPVGFEAALTSAEKRINYLRSSGKIHPQFPVVSVENFLVELLPDSWYDIGLLLLDDPWHDIILYTFTQTTPVPINYVKQAQLLTKSDYPFIHSGFAETIGSIASQNLQVHHSQWQETLTGIPRRELILLAARTLAGLYKSRLPAATP